MEDMLEGVRVVDISEFGFVPSSASALAEWGAEAIKVEHAHRGDPLRELMKIGVVNHGTGDFDVLVELLNRGKRSIGLDLTKPAAYGILVKLVERADVVTTNFLPEARRKLKITYEDLSAINPRLIYALGHGYGQHGPDNEKAGFDSISHWARGGVAHMLTPVGQPYVNQRGGFGDFTGGMSIACGVAAALYRRSVTGRGGTIDVSLLGTAVWQMAPDILASDQLGADLPRSQPGTVLGNPLVGAYQTADDRYVMLNMMQADRYWPGFCRALERPDLIEDPQFVDMAQRAANKEALHALITEAFAGATLDEWDQRLTANDCVWARVQTPAEVVQDPQVIANGYLPQHPTAPQARLAATPIQWGDQLPVIRSAAPGLGEHTEEILRELGLDEAGIAALREAGAIK